MLASAAVAALALAAPPSPLAGCTATPFERGWDYWCPPYSARVEDREDLSPEKAREYRAHAISLLGNFVGGGAHLSETTMLLAGRSTEVARFASAEDGTVGFYAVLPRSEGARTVTCTQLLPAARCPEILALLAARGWRAGAAPRAKIAKPPPLAIAGRAIAVPAGCQGLPGTYGGKIKCLGGGEAGWATMEPSMVDASLDTFERMISSSLRETGSRKAQRDTVGCRVAGKELTCGRRRHTARGGSVRTILMAVVPAGEESVVVYCAPDPRSEPCASIFEMD